MGRKRIVRTLHYLPCCRGFDPIDTSREARLPVIVSFDGLEALRLLDREGLSQEEAAARMGVSRPTLTRIYETVRRQLALALTEGLSMRFEGGSVQTNAGVYRCRECQEIVSVMTNVPPRCPRCQSDEMIELGECLKQSCQPRDSGCLSGDYNSLEKQCHTNHKQRSIHMKIAMPIDEAGNLCPHFGHAPQFAIIEVDTTAKTVGEVTAHIPTQGGHAALPAWLRSFGAECIIVGGAGRPAIENLKAHGMEVVCGAPVLPAAEVAQQWLNGQLSLNPVECGHSHHGGHHGCH